MMSHRVTTAALRRYVRRTRFTNSLNFISSRSYSAVAIPSTSTSTSLANNHPQENDKFHHHHRRHLSNFRGAPGNIRDPGESDLMEDIQDLKTGEGMEFFDALSDDDGYYPASSAGAEDEIEEIEEMKRQAVRDEIDSRKGRLWEDRWALTDEDWSSGKSFDDLPDWTEEICSRVSRERVKVHPDGVPTLEKLANLSLPASHPSHPALGNPKPYVKHRKNAIYSAIHTAVEKFAEPKMERILSMTDWDEKQNAIDDLFEHVHAAVKNSDSTDDYLSVVLGSQPTFPKLVERALEDYLRTVVGDEKMAFNQKDKDGEDNDEKVNVNSDKEAVPIFMDLMEAKGSSLDEAGVPKLIYPLKSHPHDGPGRMIEEWELSANEKTKRIMGRQCISDIARALNENDKEDSKEGSRVFVTGRRGAGKSAALTSIVASARLSGHVVLYLPDGDRLRKNGFYVEPNNHRKIAGGSEGKLFDLPLLSKEICGQLYESHSKDLDDMIVTKDTLEKSMNEDQLKKFSKSIEDVNEDGAVALNHLLKVGNDSVGLASACYSAAIDTLMAQTSKPFTIVIDEYNCFYDHGTYFHADYDPAVVKSIPLHKITLFQPLVDAMGIEKTDDGQFGKFTTKEPVCMKRGGIVAGITESHAVARHFTSDLISAVTEAGANVVDVPQYSPLEVEHILANFEIIGIGRLRFDRGETVMNKQEVAYLRMVSGGVGQPLLDACVH